MSILMTGEEHLRFIMDETLWGDGGYVEDVEIKIDGVSADETFDPDMINPESQVEIISGYVVSENPICMSGKDSDAYPALAKVWMDSQKFKTLVVQVDNEHAEALAELIRSSGGRIVT